MSESDPASWLVPAERPAQPATPVRPPAPVQETFYVHAPRPTGQGWPTTTQQPPHPHTTGAVTWVSAHGGAGATSLATATGLGPDLTAMWPDPALGWPNQVVLVARTNTAGLDAAARAIAFAASGATPPGVRVAALVLNADAPGRTPRLIKARIRELSGTVPNLLEVGWVEEWRTTPYTATKHLAGLIRALQKATPQ